MMKPVSSVEVLRCVVYFRNTVAGKDLAVAQLVLHGRGIQRCLGDRIKIVDDRIHNRLYLNGYLHEQRGGCFSDISVVQRPVHPRHDPKRKRYDRRQNQAELLRHLHVAEGPLQLFRQSFHGFLRSAGRTACVQLCASK